MCSQRGSDVGRCDVDVGVGRDGCRVHSIQVQAERAAGCASQIDRLLFVDAGRDQRCGLIAEEAVDARRDRRTHAPERDGQRCRVRTPVEFIDGRSAVDASPDVGRVAEVELVLAVIAAQQGRDGHVRLDVEAVVARVAVDVDRLKVTIQTGVTQVERVGSRCRGDSQRVDRAGIGVVSDVGRARAFASEAVNRGRREGHRVA